MHHMERLLPAGGSSSKILDLRDRIGWGQGRRVTGYRHRVRIVLQVNIKQMAIVHIKWGGRRTVMKEIKAPKCPSYLGSPLSVGSSDHRPRSSLHCPLLAGILIN